MQHGRFEVFGDDHTGSPKVALRNFSSKSGGAALTV